MHWNVRFRPDDFDMKIGMVRKQLCEYLLQNGDRYVFASRDVQPARGLVSEIAEQGQLVVDFFEPGSDHLLKVFARFRR